ncbi:hypothetical protein TNCV_2954011 [Trichonephila clavipes]|nr:hypothetical protein TNCV_2954011 [Trichonephila clavipes]
MIENWVASIGSLRSTDLGGNTRVTVEYPMHRGRSEYGVQHVILHYLVGRGRLADLEDREQPLDVRRQQCTNLGSNYCRSELEMCVSSTQWPSKPLQYRMQAGEEWSFRSLQTRTQP